MAARTHLIASKIHKWTALLLGLQVLFWIAGGAVMSWIPIELVRGEVNIAKPAPVSIAPQKIYALLGGEEGDVVSARARRVGPYPALDIRFADGSGKLLNVDTGEDMTPIGEALATEIALADYAGEAIVTESKLISEEPGDYRGPLPVWRVALNDADGTILYVSPTEGRVVARRNDYWRVYDFFWMLHIMDYDEREDFNNPLIMTASATGLLFVLSGIFLIFYRFHRRDFRIRRKRQV